MSFILDALRKSEHERERSAVPGLAASTIVRRESRLPLVLGIVATLLIVNVAILLVVLARGRTPAPVAVAPAAIAPRAAAKRFAPPAPVRPLDAEPASAEDVPVPEPPPVRTTHAVSAAGANTAAASELAAAPLGAPALSVDLHVYGPDPAGRFVVINGHRYREGDTLSEGPLLEAITPEGAVLNYRGSRFLLRRD
jgi:general secretion pathway protein B